MDRNRLNLWLDAAALVLVWGIAATGSLIFFVLPPGTGHTQQILGLGRHVYGQLHAAFGVGVLILLAAHLLLHWDWICCVVARLLGRGQPSTRARVWAGVGLTAALSLLTGLLLWGAARLVVHLPGQHRHGVEATGSSSREGGRRTISPGKGATRHANADEDKSDDD